MARLAELEEIAAQEREAELARQASELAGRVNKKKLREPANFRMHIIPFPSLPLYKPIIIRMSIIPLMQQ